MAQVPTFCPLCVSRCGATATVADGALVALGARSRAPHRAGAVHQGQGRAGARATTGTGCCTRCGGPTPRERRTRAGERISWEEALDIVAARLTELAADHGPESVVFGSASPSTSAISDSVDWMMRLKRAFGSPNLVHSMELCGWGRYLAPPTRSASRCPASYLPDLDRAGCILYWGYNPSVARLAHATATTAALRRGARLIVVDPRRAGLASKADHWLRVRPGTDAALALAMTHVMIERGWYDRDFVRRWTNAPLLVRDDDARLLRADEVFAAGDPAHYVAWDESSARAVSVRPGGARLRRRRRPAGAWTARTRSRRRRARSVPPGVRPPRGRRAARIPPEAAESAHRRARRADRRGRAHAVELPPGRVLHLERPGTAQQHHADDPRDQRAVRAYRLPGRSWRQRAVRRRADQPHRRH